MRTRAWVWRVGVGVLVGMVVTLGVAWAVAALKWDDGVWWSERGAYRDAATGTMVRVQESRWPGLEHFVVMRATPQEPLDVVERPAWVPADFEPGEIFTQTRYGWPFRALRTRSRAALKPPASPTSSLPTLVSVEQPRVVYIEIGSTFYRFPYVPEPAGFGACVAVWAGVYIGVVTLTGALRRWGRRRRGECVVCRYALGGLPSGAGCPECGRADERAGGTAPAAMA